MIAASIVVDFFRARAALPGRRRDLERGARSRRAAFRLRHVVVARGARRPRRGGARLSLGRFGRRDRRRGVHLHRRLAARPAHHRYADRYGAGRAPPTRSRAIAARIPGVVALERVRVRPAGDVLFVDLVVAVSRTLPLDRVAAIKERIENAVRGELPKAETDRQHRAARARRRDRARARHGDRAQPRARRPSRHGACDRRATVGLARPRGGRHGCRSARAHEIADGLEQAVRDELGPGGRGRDPHRAAAAERQAGRDAPPSGSPRCATPWSTSPRRSSSSGEIHDVRVRESRGRRDRQFPLLVDPALEVADVHEKVDEVERALRLRFPSIKRVIGHAEPRPVST